MRVFSGTLIKKSRVRNFSAPPPHQKKPIFFIILYPGFPSLFVLCGAEASCFFFFFGGKKKGHLYQYSIRRKRRIVNKSRNVRLSDSPKHIKRKRRRKKWRKMFRLVWCARLLIQKVWNLFWKKKWRVGDRAVWWSITRKSPAPTCWINNRFQVKRIVRPRRSG